MNCRLVPTVFASPSLLSLLFAALASSSVWAQTGTPVNDSVVSVQELKAEGKAEKYFEKGTTLLLKGDAAGSIVYFDRAIAKEPSYYRAHYDKGIAQFWLGHLDEAEAALQRAIDLTEGGYAPASFLMGMVLYQKNQFRQAETVLQRGLEVEPRSAVGRVVLGWTQFALDHLTEAERSAEQAASYRNGNFPEAYLLLARIHFRQNRLNASMNDLETYLRLDPRGEESAKANSLLEATRRAMEPSPTGSALTYLP